jgi:hypothetical protein
MPPWQSEIVELHNFFIAWLGGELPKTSEIFARFSAATAPGFALISPSGQLTERDALVQGLYEGHASRPKLQIWIERPALRVREGALSLVTYEEWQREAGRVTARQSSALFIEAPEAPNGLAWLHVHETWLPERAA